MPRLNIPLSTAFPSWAKQWHPSRNAKTAAETAGRAETLAWWLEETCGHEWEARVSARVKSSTSCWVCSGRRILAGFNDLLTLHPTIGRDWHPSLNLGLLPSHVGEGSSKKVHWLGAHCGHTWRATVSSRTSSGSGCPVCAGRQLLSGFNDLLTGSPRVAAEWHPHKNGALRPESVLNGTHKSVWWRCVQGHEWQASVVARTRPVGAKDKGAGCPYCSGRLAIVGENDLCTTHPDTAKWWHPTMNGDFLPQHTKAGSQKRVWWVGACGHEWKAKIAHRATAKSGCPYCSGNKLLVGFNDLLTTHPDVAAEWHPTRNTITPQGVMRGNKTKVWWLCGVGHEYESTPNARTNPANENGCPDCAAAAMSDGTSDMEKVVAQVVMSAFPDAIHGARVDRTLTGRRSWALDILVPSLRLVVEYDGQAWHCSCCSPFSVEPGSLEARDLAKTADLQSQGYRVMRIRTPHMGKMTDDDLLVDRHLRGPALAEVMSAHLTTLGLIPEVAAA